jgi:hypothetical protein
MAVVPYTFAGQTGTIPLSELDVNFANVKAFATTAGNVTGNIQSNITAVGTLTSLTVSGNVTAANFLGNVVGNISGNITVAGSNTQVLFNDNGLANASSGFTFNKSTNALAVTANITGGNLIISGQISATANITGGNLRTGGLVSAAGNITGGNVVASANVIGNLIVSGSGQFGIANGITTLSLANNRAETIFIGSGNATNVYIANAASTTHVAGNLSVVGNILTGGIVSTTANITGGNLSVSGTSTLTGVATAPTAANGTSNTQVATTAFVTNALINRVPSGVIVMWSGSIASIPTGWFLCDGGNSTPDLRDRFIVGAGVTYTPGNTGGSANAIVVSHTHTASSVVSDPGHSHGYTAPASATSDAAGFDTEIAATAAANTAAATTGITVATTVNSTGSSATNANLPPYYALAYIMKA